MKRKKSKEESKTIHKESFIQGKKKKGSELGKVCVGEILHRIFCLIFLEKSDTWMENQMRGNKVGKKYWK